MGIPDTYCRELGILYRMLQLGKKISDGDQQQERPQATGTFILAVGLGQLV